MCFYKDLVGCGLYGVDTKVLGAVTECEDIDNLCTKLHGPSSRNIKQR